MYEGKEAVVEEEEEEEGDKGEEELKEDGKRGRKMETRRESKEEGHKTELNNNKRIAFRCCLINEQECIIRFKKFLNLIIQGCEFFERLQNLQM